MPALLRVQLLEGVPVRLLVAQAVLRVRGLHLGIVRVDGRLQLRDLAAQVLQLLVILQLLLGDLNFGLGRGLLQLLYLETVLRDGRLLDVQELPERHLVPLELLQLRAGRLLVLLFVLLQLRHVSLQILRKQLQLVLD